MSQALPSPINCGESNCTEITVQVPGPIGPSGADGADGMDGVSAYTFLTAELTVPALNATVDADVVNARWMALGQVVYVAESAVKAEYFQVTVLISNSRVTLKNLGYTGYAPTSKIAINAKVTSSGVAGADGPAGGDALLKANNLDDLTNAATARTNLGLGTMATQPANNVTIAGGSIAGITDLAVADGGTGASTAVNARTALGAAASGLATASGLTSSDTDKVIGRSTAGAGALEEIACTAVARTFLAAATVAAELAALKALPRYGLLGSAISVNASSAASTAIAIASAKYIIRRIVINNSNNSVSTATGGLFAGGTALAADQSLALASAAHFKDLTLAAGATSYVRTETSLNFTVGTAEGAGKTIDVWIFGEKFD